MAPGTPAPMRDTLKGGLVARQLDDAGNVVLLSKLASTQSNGQELSGSDNLETSHFTCTHKHSG